MTKTISINFKRFDKNLPLPVFKTKGAVAADMYCRTSVTIPPHQIAYIPQNVAIEIPENHFIIMSSRSSAHKLGIMQANSIGIFDQDFCGNDDEYVYIAYNFTDKEITIEKGTRIAQIICLPYKTFQVIEKNKFKSPTRGGIGSTGVK